LKLHKDSYFLVSWIIIAITLFVFVFLALLNNRYMRLGSTMVFDKWSGKCSIPQHKENLKPEKITENTIDNGTKQP
jgi:hypothetical protein